MIKFWKNQKIEEIIFISTVAELENKKKLR
jgi:hypothetical protein